VQPVADDAATQFGYSAPAVPAYEAPAQPVADEDATQYVYSAPAAAPAAPAYEAPAAPAYEAPAAPAYEAPAYQAQQQAYQPPVQSASTSGSYVPPAAPAKPAKPKKGGNKILFLVGGIVVALIVVAVLLISMLGGGSDQKTAEEIGLYNAVSCVMEDEEVELDGEWIELMAKGKAEVYLMEETYEGKWSLDGDEFTFEQAGTEYTGTLEDGVLTLEFEDLEYTFVKEGMEEDEEEEEEPADEEDPKEDEPAPDDAATAAPALPEEVGYWTLSGMEQDGQTVGEEEIAAMKEAGVEVFMVLYEDGTGVLVTDEPLKMIWGDGEIVPEDEPEEPAAYTIEEGVLRLEADGMSMSFVRGEGDAPEIEWPTEAPAVEPPAAEPPAVEEVPEPDPVSYDAWEGDWYGWWVVWEGFGGYAQYTDNFWDAYARIDVEGDTGYIAMWDTTTAADDLLMETEVSFAEGSTEWGIMKAEAGYFLDEEMESGEWTCDPADSTMTEFGNTIVIEGEYVDPANAGDSFEYILILRPWGESWDDIREADHSGNYYDDMMPEFYDEWYLPLVEAGYDLPDSFAEGEEMLAAGAPAAPAASGDALIEDTLVDYHVSVVGAECLKDDDGDDAMRIYMDFTNNSEETTSPYMALTVVAEQDGTELDDTYIWSEENFVPESDYYYTDIQPGITVRFAAEFKLIDPNAPVKLTVLDWWTESESFELTLDPANMPGKPANTLAIKQIWDPTYVAGLEPAGEYREDYIVAIANTEVVPAAWAEEDVIRVYLEFVNNSDEAVSFWDASNLRAYQNGIMLSGWATPDEEIPEDENYELEVEPGQAVVVSHCFYLRDETPVEIEVYDYSGGESLGLIVELN